MRILQLCTKVPFPPRDGGSLGVYMFSKTLVQLGHQVTIIAVNPPKHYVANSNADTPHGVKIIPVSINTNIRLLPAIVNLFFSKLPYQVDRFISKAFKTALTETLNEFNPDIVQIEGIYLTPYINELRLFTKPKIILRCHNIEFHLWHQIAERENNIFKRAYLFLNARRLRKFELQQLQQADGLTTVTANDRDFLLKQKANNCIKFISYGVDIEKTNVISSENASDIAYLGALDWLPNQHTLVWFINNVWFSLVKQYPGCTFHIAGRNAPKWLANYLGTIPNVRFYGEIEDTDGFYSNSNIMVSPLFTGSGVRVKIIEEMNKGKIIVATDKAIEGIPAAPGNHYIQANTANEFIAKLGLLLSGNVDNKTISANAKLLVSEKFDILAITKDLTIFYQELIDA